MRANGQRRPVTRAFRAFFRLLITLTSIAAALYLMLLILSASLRLKWVSEKIRRLTKPANALLRAHKIAGTRWGILYFNLSALKHVGRRSGREYVTPLGAYPLGDGFVLALAYGPDVDWYRNVLAAGKCTLKWRGQEYALERPEIIPASQALRAYPLHTRLQVMAAGIKEFLWVHRQSEVPAEDLASTPS